jgi:hypothetical protein
MPVIPTIGFAAYDVGVIRALGGKLIEINLGQPEGVRQAFAVTVPGVTTNMELYAPHVPVFFSTPEDVNQVYRLPCFVVKRRDPTPAFDRAPFYGFDRVPAPDAKPVTAVINGRQVTGYDKYVTLSAAVPMNMGYDVQVNARSQRVGLQLLQYALSAFRPPYFTVGAIDSSGVERYYDAGEVSVSDNSELADIANRTISWSISFDVRGEIDLAAEHVEDAIVTSLDAVRIRVQVVSLNVVRLMTRVFVR